MGRPAHPYDFLDVDGTKVDVKSSKGMSKERNRWSFAIRSVTHPVVSHMCDIYSCLCLNDAGDEILHEFRIPAVVVGDRWLIHIYAEYQGTIWEQYLVPDSSAFLCSDINSSVRM